MPVGTRTRATTTRLDAEQVVEQSHHEVVVKETLVMPDQEGNDGQALRLLVAENTDPRVGGPAVDRAFHERVLELLDDVLANRGLELEDQAGTNRLDRGIENGRSGIYPVPAIFRGIPSNRLYVNFLTLY